MRFASKTCTKRTAAALAAAVAGISYTTTAYSQTTYTNASAASTEIKSATDYEGEPTTDPTTMYWDLDGTGNNLEFATWGVLDFGFANPAGTGVTAVGSNMTINLVEEGGYEFNSSTSQTMNFYLATDTSSAEVQNGATTLLYEPNSTNPGGLNNPGQPGSFVANSTLSMVGSGTWTPAPTTGVNPNLTATLNLTAAEQSYIQTQINSGGGDIRIVVTNATETDTNDADFFGGAAGAGSAPTLQIPVTTETVANNSSVLYVGSMGNKTATVNVGTYLTDHGTPGYFVLQGETTTTTVTLLNANTVNGDTLNYSASGSGATGSTSPGPDPIPSGTFVGGNDTSPGTAMAMVGFNAAETANQAGSGGTISGTVTFSNFSNVPDTPVTVNINPVTVLQERHVDSFGSTSNNPTEAPNVGGVLVGKTASVTATITTDNPVNIDDYSPDALTTLTLNANQTSNPYTVDDFFTKAPVGTIVAVSPSYAQVFNTSNSGNVTAMATPIISGQYGDDTPVIENGITQTYAPNFAEFEHSPNITGDGMQGETDSMDVYVQWTGFQPASVTANGTNGSPLVVPPNSNATASLTNAATNDNIYNYTGGPSNNGLRDAAQITGETAFNQTWAIAGGWTAPTFTTGSVIPGSESIGDTNSYSVNGTVAFATNSEMINGTYGTQLTVYLENSATASFNSESVAGVASNDLTPVTLYVQSTVTSNPANQSGSYNLNGGTLTATGTDLTGSFTQAGGTSTFTNINGSGTVNVTGGTLNLAAPNFRGNLNVSSAGTAVVTSGGALGAVSITGPGTATLATGSHGSTASSVSITSGGVLDITNNHLIINYSGASPKATILSYLVTGAAGGAWDGTGIISSTAASQYTGGTPGNYGISFADGADNVDPALTSGQIEVSYAQYGDITQQGLVNAADFHILASFFGQTTTEGWEAGDFLYQGVVNAEDFHLLAENFGQTASGEAVAMPASDWEALDAFAQANGISPAVVPEPAGLLVLAGIGVLAKRARRKRLD